MAEKSRKGGDLDHSSSFISRELSFLAFARRVLSLVGRGDLPLLERIKFAGIVGMLHDEFFMKRDQRAEAPDRQGLARSARGRWPDSPRRSSRPAAPMLARTSSTRWTARRHDRAFAAARPSNGAGLGPILALRRISNREQKALPAAITSRAAFEPILTPLDRRRPNIPFPFISNLGLQSGDHDSSPARTGIPNRFIRIKVPEQPPEVGRASGSMPDTFLLEQSHRGQPRPDVIPRLHGRERVSLLPRHCVEPPASRSEQADGPVRSASRSMAPGRIVGQLSRES